MREKRNNSSKMENSFFTGLADGWLAACAWWLADRSVSRETGGDGGERE
jgi:hypothetical protein